MRYFLLNKVEYEEHNEEPVVLRVPNRVFKQMGACAKLVRKARECERKVLKLLADSNKTTVAEIDDIIATNDWGVDQMSYGIHSYLEGEITQKEYQKLKKGLS